MTKIAYCTYWAGKPSSVGQVLNWRGTGPMFMGLSAVLSAFDSTWRRREWKPWHMAVIVGQDKDGDWIVFEATWPRTRAMPLSVLEQIYGTDYRVYDWFGHGLDQAAVDAWVKARLGAKYDAIVYVFTVLQYLVWRWFKLSLPRVIDGAYDCWELVEEFCADFGKPWSGTHNRLHRYPMIADFLNEAEPIEGGRMSWNWGWDNWLTVAVIAAALISRGILKRLYERVRDTIVICRNALTDGHLSWGEVWQILKSARSIGDVIIEIAELIYQKQTSESTK